MFICVVVLNKFIVRKLVSYKYCVIHWRTVILDGSMKMCFNSCSDPDFPHNLVLLFFQGISVIFNVALALLKVRQRS